jgi:CubicO group peptidase (beta-lactamase class C family)
MALLVEQGKLSWEDPVDKHLHYFAGIQVRGKGPASRVPKVRELLSHTAGFPGQPAIDAGQWTIKTNGTLGDAVEDLPRQGLAAEPGTTYAYTGLGYMVAGRIAEVLTGQDFATLMHEQLLRPIGATTATFDYSEELRARMPIPYERKNGEFVKVDVLSRLEAAGKFPNPAGRLISTLEDVGRFLQLHRNRGVAEGQRLISAEGLRALYKPQPATGKNGYGLGFNCLRMGPDGYAVRIRHIGASGTLAELDFERDLGIVLLTQVPQNQVAAFRDRLLKEIYSVLSPGGE